MKKLFLMLAMMLPMCVFTMCTKENNDKLIENKFIEYARVNFDDPKSLHQIVSIQVKDTLSTMKLKNMWYDLSYKIDSMQKVNKDLQECNLNLVSKDDISLKIKKNKELKYKLSESLLTIYENANTSMNLLKEYTPIDSLEFSNLPDTTIIFREIKYREEDENGRLKIKSAYCASDLGLNTIIFSCSGEEDCVDEATWELFHNISHEVEYKTKAIHLEIDYYKNLMYMKHLVQDK